MNKFTQRLLWICVAAVVSIHPVPVGCEQINERDFEWPSFRHDPQATGHSAGMGAYRQAPAHSLRLDPGQPAPSVVQVMDLNGDGISEIIYSTSKGVHVMNGMGNQLYAAPNEKILAVADFDGNGEIEVLFEGPIIADGKTGKVLWQVQHKGTAAYRTFVGKMRKERAGYQLVLVNGWTNTNTAWVYDFTAGYEKAELLWTRQINESEIYDHGSVAIGFLKSDGETPVIVAAMKGRVILVDLVTGEELNRVEWKADGEDTHRNYGIVHVIDTDKDGWNDILLTNAVISQQLACVENKETTGLRLKWSRWFSWWYPQGTKALRVCVDSVSDLDRDGMFEVVSSVYDKNWTLEITDAISGEVRASRENLLLQEVVSLGENHPPLLVCSREPSRVRREMTDLVFVSYENGNLRTVLELTNARMPGQPRNTFPVGKGGRSDGSDIPLIRDDDGDGALEIALVLGDQDRIRASAICLMGWSGEGKFIEKHRIPLDAKAKLDLHAWGNVDDDPSAEFVLTSSSGEIRILDSNGELKRCWSAASTYAAYPVAVDLTGDGKAETIVPTAAGTVRAFQIGNDGKTSILWETEGYGVPAYYAQIKTVIAGDLNSDGNPEVAIVRPSSSGLNAVVALDAHGDLLWQTDTPEVTWTLKYPAAARLALGRFTGNKGCDVYFAGRKSPTGHDSASSFVLDGRTGNVVWANHAEDPRLEFHTIGPMALPAVADCNNDGAEDIYLNALHMLTCLDGKTGRMLLEPKMFNDLLGERKPGERKATWTAYGSFTPRDINQDGEYELLSVANFGCFGAFTLDRMPIWLVDPVDPDRHVRTHPGVADVDGDGALEFGTPLANEFLCYDAASGKLEWSLTIPGTAWSDVITVDIDGQGASEFLVTRGSVLCAIAAQEGAGQILWQLDLPAVAYMPIVADVMGDDTLEILVPCADGAIHVFGRGIENK
ncbi:MAG TPA: hypothetical protein PK395_11975 [bacterium]|nr:hypothetical protein [bacterium]HQP97253.1 hypothetical protein [bacterium]